jgi:putative nucleotidyltransferase with HDIG domain
VTKWARARYRVTQFGRWILDSVRPIDRAYVRERLSAPALAELFARMPRADQHHGITAAQTLERRGHNDPDLITAALLHDVGKRRAPVSIWGRVITVLGEWLLPARAARWGREEARGLRRRLRRPFVVRRQHAAWGAEMVRRAGGSEATIRLIRSHHDPVEAPDADRRMLAALRAADEE